MKKLSYILLLMSVIFAFWHLDSSIKAKHFEIDTLTQLVSQQQEELKALRQQLEQKEAEIQLLLEEVQRLKTIRAKVTAYAPLDNKSGICADSNPNITSRGVRPRRGIIAVDPKKIPYGTQVYIPGYGVASAEDTGGAIRRYDGIAIDVVVDSHEEAIRWGVQYLDVTIQ